jgi:arsenite methyltransferase
MSHVEFDEDMAARVETLYHIADAVRRRRIVREVLAASPGERILDIGCGPGFHCAELAALVGSAGSVVGVDSSPAMLGLASRRCAGLEGVELREAVVVSLLVDVASFDAALCVQVLEYVADPTVTSRSPVARHSSIGCPIECEVSLDLTTSGILDLGEFDRRAALI